MKKLISAILFTAVVFLPLAAQAGEVYNRLQRQDRRIDSGLQHGTLTQKQANRLERRDHSINAQRVRDLRPNDGRLTRREYNHLNHRLNRTSRAIYHDKHS